MHRLVVALAFLVATPSLALANCLVVGTSGIVTSVYFSNGMSGDESSARLNRLALEQAYKGGLEARYPGSRFIFSMAYNTGDGVGDLVEVVRQKLGEYRLAQGGRPTATQLLGWLLAQVPYEQISRIWRTMTRVGRRITSDEVEDIRDALASEWRRVLEEDSYSAPENHIVRFQAALQSGERVIVVAHSQGNLFANEAVQEASDRQPQCADSIAVVGVATPASKLVNGTSGYVTAKDDIVINYTRDFFSDVLPGNVDNRTSEPDERDGLHHFFYESYFAAGLESRRRIDSLMEMLAEDLPYPD